MSLHIGDKNIVDIRRGETKIARVYKGNTLVWGYTPGEVLFDSSSSGPGIYPLYVKCRCKLEVKLVGGGGGCASFGGYYSNNYTLNSSGGGGAGAYVHGIIEVQSGNYNIVVGSGGDGVRAAGVVGQQIAYDGTNTSVFGQTAEGGKGGKAGNDGTGGAGGVYSTILTGEEGGEGGSMPYVVARNSYPIQDISGGASLYGGYGAGGYIEGGSLENYNGSDGYVKIVAV